MAYPTGDVENEQDGIDNVTDEISPPHSIARGRRERLFLHGDRGSIHAAWSEAAPPPARLSGRRLLDRVPHDRLAER